TRLLTLVDSALKLFPDDPGLQKKRADLSTAPQTAASLAAAPYLTKGLESFQKKDYDAAIQNFLRAGALDPGNYIFWENTALCYYVQNQWKLASAYFDKALRLNTARNGKSEFYKGVCLATMGDTTGACRFFHLSAAKNYPEAQNQISLICK
ncbi:MAG: tetratricopeptide repeat protein, partial [Flavisolibacter sp.]